MISNILLALIALSLIGFMAILLYCVKKRLPIIEIQRDNYMTIDKSDKTERKFRWIYKTVVAIVIGVITVVCLI